MYWPGTTAAGAAGFEAALALRVTRQDTEAVASPPVTSRPVGQALPGTQAPAAHTVADLPCMDEPDLFFANDEHFPAIGPIDITGLGRILVFGPYINLTPGPWSATVVIGFSAETAGFFSAGLAAASGFALTCLTTTTTCLAAGLVSDFASDLGAAASGFFAATRDLLPRRGVACLSASVATAAIKAAFGDHAYRLAMTSTKSMTGHMMGAAGAVEGIACVLAIANGIIPPTINYRYPDPDCDLDYVPNQSRRASVSVAMSNSMGLGGHNSSIIFRALQDD